MGNKLWSPGLLILKSHFQNYLVNASDFLQVRMIQYKESVIGLCLFIILMLKLVLQLTFPSITKQGMKKMNFSFCVYGRTFILVNILVQLHID